MMPIGVKYIKRFCTELTKSTKECRIPDSSEWNSCSFNLEVLPDKYWYFIKCYHHNLLDLFYKKYPSMFLPLKKTGDLKEIL